jgi:hypothetical protein
MTMLRVVLDTNVFSQDHFDAIDASPIRELCRRGRVSLIYGDVFLEEMAQAYMSSGVRADLIKRWLPFIAETAHRLGRELPLIWHEEIVQGRGVHASNFMSKREQQNLLNEFATLPMDGSWSAVAETQDARSIAKAKKLAQRKLSLEMREEVMRKLRERQIQPASASAKGQGFSLRNEITQFIGQEMIKRYVGTRNPIALTSSWIRNPERYPYFTQFAINIAFKEAHFMTQPNAPIDINAQSDLDIMTHLLRADVLVTNEKGFMRSAFDYLWRPQKKVVFTSNEFADLLRKFMPK